MEWLQYEMILAILNKPYFFLCKTGKTDYKEPRFGPDVANTEDAIYYQFLCSTNNKSDYEPTTTIMTICIMRICGTPKKTITINFN